MTSGEQTYALLFEEGPGYILAEPLVHGSQGQCYLVISVADGKYYIRKQFYPEDSTAGTPKKNLINELSYVPAQYVPQHISTTAFDKPIGDATVFEFCSGGDLGQLIKLYKDRQQQIPEVLLWQTAMTIIECLAFAHTGFKYNETDTKSGLLPQVKHNDIHSNNIFLQWASEDRLVPSIRLGDWGAAQVVSPDSWLPGFQLSWDVTCLWQTLVDMAERCENSSLIYNRYKGVYPPDHPAGAFEMILREGESLQRNDPSTCLSRFVAQRFIPIAEKRIKQLQAESVVDLRSTKPALTSKFVSFADGPNQNLYDSFCSWQKAENQGDDVLQPWRWVKVEGLPESLRSRAQIWPT